MTDSIQGPVNSAITQLLQHIEVAMWAEGIGPDEALRVINRVTFGTPDGSPAGGSVEGIPSWAEGLASAALSRIWGAVLGRGALDSEYDRAEADVKLVMLALVRQVLQSQPGPIGQALSER